MKKICDIFNKYKIAFFTSIIIVSFAFIIILIYSFFYNKISIKNISVESFSLEYDSSWKEVISKDNRISLRHGDAYIDVSLNNIIDFDSSFDTLVDNFIYNVQSENKNYKLISRKSDRVTNFMVKGEKILFEDRKNQILYVLFQTGDNLVSFKYQSKSEVFDILLDSFYNVVDNFKLNNNTKLSDEDIKLDLSEVKFYENKELENMINGTNEFVIASNNYEVKYTLPDIFSARNFDSSIGFYDFIKDLNSFKISTYVVSRNIYSYLNKNETGNLFNSYKYYREDESYENIEENINKLDSKNNNYIYKFHYEKKHKSSVDYKMHGGEEVVLLFGLDNNHFFMVIVTCNNNYIPKKIIDSIKITNFKNYSSYIKIDVEDGMLKSNLKTYTTYDKTKMCEVNIKIPSKYKEIDKENNFYQDRYFALNYNDDKSLYDYEIHYGISILSPDVLIDTFKSSRFDYKTGAFEDIHFSNKVEYSGYNFDVYSGGYIKLGGIVFTDINRFEYYVNVKYLFCEIKDYGYFYIEIKGQDKEVTDDIIKELTNIEIINRDV